MFACLGRINDSSFQVLKHLEYGHVFRTIEKSGASLYPDFDFGELDEMVQIQFRQVGFCRRLVDTQVGVQPIGAEPGQELACRLVSQEARDFTIFSNRQVVVQVEGQADVLEDDGLYFNVDLAVCK